MATPTLAQMARDCSLLILTNASHPLCLFLSHTYSKFFLILHPPNTHTPCCFLLICVQVDVMYPASPLFLLINFDTASPMKLLLLPVLDYANNQTFHYGLDIPYNLSWAPHHLGRWPSQKMKCLIQYNIIVSAAVLVCVCVCVCVCGDSRSCGTITYTMIQFIFNTVHDCNAI